MFEISVDAVEWVLRLNAGVAKCTIYKLHVHFSPSFGVTRENNLFCALSEATNHGRTFWYNPTLMTVIFFAKFVLFLFFSLNKYALLGWFLFLTFFNPCHPPHSFKITEIYSLGQFTNIQPIRNVHFCCSVAFVFCVICRFVLSFTLRDHPEIQKKAPPQFVLVTHNL